MTTSLFRIGLAFVVCLLPFAGAQAAEQKGGGSITYVPVAVDRSQLPDGRLVVRASTSGIIIADDQTVPFHLASQDCTGTQIVSADGKLLTGAGYCNAIDKDGDAWWIWWRNEGNDSVWGVIEGSGKYAGMAGGGTTKTLVRLPDGRIAIRWDGAWELK